MRVKISVTQEDIDRGNPGMCPTCPVAIAANRILHPYKCAVMPIGNGSEMALALNGEVYDLPKKVFVFVDRFDWGKPVKPLSFYLNVPDSLVKTQ